MARPKRRRPVEKTKFQFLCCLRVDLQPHLMNEMRENWVGNDLNGADRNLCLYCTLAVHRILSLSFQSSRLSDILGQMSMFRLVSTCHALHCFIGHACRRKPRQEIDRDFCFCVRPLKDLRLAKEQTTVSKFETGLTRSVTFYAFQQGVSVHVRAVICNCTIV